MPHPVALGRDRMHVDVRVVMREDGLVLGGEEAEKVHGAAFEVEALVVLVR